MTAPLPLHPRETRKGIIATNTTTNLRPTLARPPVIGKAFGILQTKKKKKKTRKKEQHRCSTRCEHGTHYTHEKVRERKREEEKTRKKKVSLTQTAVRTAALNSGSSRGSNRHSCQATHAPSYPPHSFTPQSPQQTKTKRESTNSATMFIAHSTRVLQHITVRKCKHRLIAILITKMVLIFSEQTGMEE